MYKLEQDLVDDFINNVSGSSFSEAEILDLYTEFDYSRGRTDIILLNAHGDIIAVEAKLNKWRDALHQAYRNTCFAQYSYILVPEDVSRIAKKYIFEFTRRSVGLCSMSGSNIFIEFSAKRVEPIQDYLFLQAKKKIEDNKAYA